jgi:hypothetical protein
MNVNDSISGTFEGLNVSIRYCQWTFEPQSLWIAGL